ncbi:hypothetical protein Pla175_14490 [Pirellulimonas nuda]|uniref:DUF2167 domain-containing protein n=1 Tax=Pirellulimonas nuda TaxID=2528009 RepID=A0A518D9C1_9BACT|nr:DUF2167 domain-containing protein [Pirellulimonas nuda]QDU88079.1 hypothetical protein Pla175_14490 [Pirellulimonas nuda]
MSKDSLFRTPHLLFLAGLLLVVAPAGLYAQQDADSGEDEQGFEQLSPEQIDALMTEKLGLQWQQGPTESKIGSQAQIKVPAGYRFLDSSGSQNLLEAFGNIADDEDLGLISPQGTTDWFVVFSFDNVGYVKDDEKGNIDKAALLEQFRESSKIGNDQRRSMGLPPLNFVGWAVEPYYNDEANSLEWGLKYESEGDGVVNYFTKRLGRRGVMNCNLVVDPEDLDSVLPKFRSALAGFEFASGEKYAEFKAGDKVAEYGLTALVAGGALAIAAKSGLLAKFWKLIVLGVVGAGALLKKLFGGGSKSTTA